MTRELRNEREAHMALDCCTQSGFKDGCGQGDRCPHWGRVSSNVKYMEEIRKPTPGRPVRVTPQQARDMDETAGFGGVPDHISAGGLLRGLAGLPRAFWVFWRDLPIHLRMSFTKPMYRREKWVSDEKLAELVRQFSAKKGP